MSGNTDNAAERAIMALLYPLVRLCLRHAIGIRQLMEFAKRAYVECATHEIGRAGKKVNVSRLCAMTGLHRKEIAEMVHRREQRGPPVGIVARVLGQWEQDPRFQNSRRRPRPLSHEGEQSEFKMLVNLISSDLNPGTVLFELERLGFVVRKDNKVSLMRKVALETRDPDHGVRMLSQDLRDLTSAVIENLDSPSQTPHLHGRTEYDNIAPADLPALRALLIDEGNKIHARVRELVSKYDRDVSGVPEDGRGRAKIAFVTFSYSQDDTQNQKKE